MVIQGAIKDKEPIINLKVRTGKVHWYELKRISAKGASGALTKKWVETCVL